MSLKYSTDFTVDISRSQNLYSQKKCHSLPGYLKKCMLQQSSRKLNLINMLQASSITSIHLIQFIMDLNCHDFC